MLFMNSFKSFLLYVHRKDKGVQYPFSVYPVLKFDLEKLICFGLVHRFLTYLCILVLTSEFLSANLSILSLESNFIFVVAIFEPPIKCPQVSYPLKVEQVDRKDPSVTNGCRLVIMLVCHYTKNTL